MSKYKISVIITAGGSSTRYGNKNKLLETLKGKEVILHSIDAFLPLEPEQIVISASQSLEPIIKDLLEKQTTFNNIKIVLGGPTRQESVFNALKACDSPDFVLIHDAARPLVKTDDIRKCLAKAKETKAAILSVKAVDTIKKVNESQEIIETPDRNYLWSVQTPQIFDYSLILGVHKKLAGESFTDDAGMLEHEGILVNVVEGSYSNIKITTQNDIAIAEVLMEQNANVSN